MSEGGADNWRLGSQTGGFVLLGSALIDLLLSTWFVEARAQLMVAVLVDTVLAGLLFARVVRVREWALVRALAGAILGTLAAVQHEVWGLACIELFLSLAVTLALLGPAGLLRRRLAFGAVGGALCACVWVLGGPASGSSDWRHEDFVSGDAERVRGIHADYSLQFPPGWRTTTEAARSRDVPLADRWIVRPDVEANVMVYVHRTTSLEEARDLVLADGDEAGALLIRELPEEDGAVSLDLEADVAGELVEMRAVLFPTTDMIVELRTVIARAHLESLTDELGAIEASLELPP